MSERGHHRGSGGGGGGGARGGAGRGRGRGHSRPGSRGRGTFAQHRQPRDSGYTARQNRNTSDAATASIPDGSLCCDHVDENPASSSSDPATAPSRCNFRTHSALSLMLHKADRHLTYPDGGIEELKRLDPMLIAEQREQQRRMRQQQRHRNPHPLPARPAGRMDRPFVAEEDDADSDDLDSDEDVGDGDSSESPESEDEKDPPQAGIARDEGRALDGPADATISGLNIQLDSPELIAEWINQRKKRWPTQSVVQEKLKERHERQKRSEAIYGPRPTPYNKRQRDEATASMAGSSAVKPHTDEVTRVASDEKRQKFGGENRVAAEADGKGSTSVQDESESDDEAPEEASSKVPVAPLEEDDAPRSRFPTQDRRPICTHFLQGRCNYGDRCKKRHDRDPQQQQQANTKPTRRPHPRPPPVNPFDQPDLLRQLLRNEIEKHVDAVGQAIRFIVNNDMLLHVETEEGQAEEQKRQRDKIQVLSSEDGTEIEPHEDLVEAKQTGTTANAHLTAAEAPTLTDPILEGGLAVLKPASDASGSQSRAYLYRPTAPVLRSLSELKYPPEPDPLIFLDPLRRDDPKPLLPSQLVRIAKDPVIRSVLTPCTPFHPNGHKPASLERAIISLDALPTDLYRNAAIEMILGIASSNAASAGGAGLVVVSKDGRRKVSETDLFRMGLRVGGDEVLAIKKLADRLSVLLDSSLQLDEVGEADWALLTAEQRNEMRRLHYDREADRLERLRKLGVDV
ncbi:C3H1-type domain-containing protein [Pseudozyma hubeiensis]|nr:C3H1-type domain-containing protein [Pseudozyma hubeiensis]